MVSLVDVSLNIHGFKARKRVGRGVGSGHGKTSGRGHKGAGSRSGTKARRGHEGGQKQLFRRVAKRGFNGAEATVRALRASQVLCDFPEAAVISTEMLRTRYSIPREMDVKIIRGADVPLSGPTIEANCASVGAIEQLGSRLIVVGN